MEVLYLISFFLFGTILGSFFHVVGTRLPKEESLLYPGSHCDICHHPLKAKDLIPVFSFLFQKGRCRYCKTKLSIMHLMIELATGLLFAISYYSFGFSIMLCIALGIISLFIIIMVSDLTYLIIPDEVLLFFFIYFFILQLVQGGIWNGFFHLLNGIFLFAIMYGFMYLGNKMFKKESLGGGDVKLFFLVGLILDPFQGVFTIFLASFIALPVSLLLYFTKEEGVIPFGPFIVLALLLLFFMKIDITLIETIWNL